MTDKHKAIMALIKLQTAKATCDQETARQVLIDEGIYDKDGNLTPEYGGPILWGPRLRPGEYYEDSTKLETPPSSKSGTTK